MPIVLNGILGDLHHNEDWNGMVPGSQTFYPRRFARIVICRARSANPVREETIRLFGATLMSESQYRDRIIFHEELQVMEADFTNLTFDSSRMVDEY